MVLYPILLQGRAVYLRRAVVFFYIPIIVESSATIAPLVATILNSARIEAKQKMLAYFWKTSKGGELFPGQVEE